MLPTVFATSPPVEKGNSHDMNSLSERALRAVDAPISDLMHRALSRPELISLAAGFVDQQSLPVDALREAVDALMSDPIRSRRALQYGTTTGDPELREMLRTRLLNADRLPPAAISADQIVVTAGSNQLLHHVADTLLDPGDLVLCANPTYFVFLGLLGNLGARGVGVDVDEEGLIPEALEATLERLQREGSLARVKALYLTSYFDNPSSITLSAARRPQVVEIVKRWSRQQRLYLLEDVAYRELRYAGDDLPTLRSYDDSGEHVILAQTFSKSFSPGLRVGFGVLPPELVRPIANQKGNLDFGSPNFNQQVLATALDRGLHEPHVERLRTVYREKLTAMLSAADEHLADLPGVSWHRPSGGLYVWLRLPPHIDTGAQGALFQRAINEGVLYVPGGYCDPEGDRATTHSTIRLSFGVQSCERIREGIAALARAIRHTMDA